MLSTVVFLTLLVATTTQSPELPYSLVFVEPEKGNTYQLRCTDKYGISVPNAVFFRDGAPNATDKTDCFQSLNDTGLGYVELSLTSECDGRFMCGVKSEMGFILSGPTEIIGKCSKIVHTQLISDFKLATHTNFDHCSSSFSKKNR